MKSTRFALLAAVLIGALGVTSGCATAPAIEDGDLAAATKQTSPTDAEIGIACGVARILEPSPENYHSVRVDALQEVRDFYAKHPERNDMTTHIPHSLFAEMLTAALVKLPEVERDLGHEDPALVEVTNDGGEFGFVEIETNWDGEYAVGAFGLYPTDQGLCDEHDVGDFGD